MITAAEQLTSAPNFQPRLTWGDSLVRVATVWGLGTGLAIVAALTAALIWHLGGGPHPALLGAASTIGISTGGGVVYLDYVKRHIRLDPARKAPAARVISGVAVLGTLFLFALLLSALMPLILLVGIPYVESKRQRGTPWREQTDMFIGELLPRVAIF